MKFGECLICKRKKNVQKLIKMKDSNTSSLRRHVLSCHPKIYNNAFKMKITATGK